MRAAGPLGLLAAAALAAFGGALANGFVWDDGAMIVHNPGVAGLALSNWRWMFSTLYLSSYMPLGWAALALLRAAFGLNPEAFHAASLAAHWLTALAFGAVARRLLERARLPKPRETALAAALLFAAHPLQSASVAWAAILPDVLATLLFLLALRAYLDARQGAALALYAGSLLFRWTGLSLPVALLIVDCWPLRRKAFAEKIPFFAVGAVFAAATALGKARAAYGPAFMPAAFCRGLWVFPWKLLWPSRVLPVYALHEPDTLGLPAWAALALTAAAAAWLWLGRKRRPWAAAAAGFYAAALLPPLLNSQAGTMFVFPKYAYLSCLPAYLLAAEGLRRFWKRRREAAGALAVAAAAVFLSVSRAETAAWRDSIRYWTRAIALDPGCRVAYGNLGAALIDAGRFNDAYFVLASQLAYNPGDAVAQDNMTVLRARAPRLEPDQASFLADVAADLEALGRNADAARYCGKALRLKPALEDAACRSPSAP